jgi:adenylate cyclase
MDAVAVNFEYDIFISYRQNDNRSGWVSEFVKTLQDELAATIKEPISIYFDSNPYDSLRETYIVDKSLEGKLKCIILIPIISQTYTDTKSFAWQHEFCAFNKLASEDSIGRDIRLGNGNVASRILPVKIHDLDKEDQARIENEIGGFLRAVEFIYKEPGVNRPLKPKDKRNDNLNKTDYRNQVNKVANSIKEIITSLKSPNENTPRLTNTYRVVDTTLKQNRSQLTIILAIVMLFIVGFVTYLRYTSSSATIDSADKSIAVLPFVNISKDPDQEYFSDQLAVELINHLNKIPGLRVIGQRSSFSFKDKNEDLRVIGAKLGVSYLLEGSVRKSGNILRITANLINASDGTQISEVYNEEMEDRIEDIFKTHDEISAAVVRSLKLSFFKEDTPIHRSVNLEAYKLYLLGRYYYFQSDPRGFQAFEAALKIDSSYADAWAGIAIQLISMGNDSSTSHANYIKKVRNCAQRALVLNANQPEAIASRAYMYFIVDHNYDQVEREVEQGLMIDPNNYDLLTILSQIHIVKGKMNKAERTVFKLMEIDPINPFTYITYARMRWAQGKLAEAEDGFKSAYEISPRNAGVPYSLGLISLERGDGQQALDRLVNKGTESFPICRIASSMAYFTLGRKKESDEILLWAETQYANMYPGAIAYCYAFRKDKDKFFYWINHAIDQFDTPEFLIVHPNFFTKEIRMDPRFKEIASRLNLPK